MASTSVIHAKDLATYAALLGQLKSVLLTSQRKIEEEKIRTYKEGDQAKAFVQSLLKEADEITIRSFRDDKYGRYLADVFIVRDEGEVYLNGLLLDQGHAVRYE